MAELIVALDFAAARQAIDMAALLRPAVRWFKVGLELFVSAGPELVRQLRDLQCRVFLDLKFYDIPNTVAAAVKAAAALGAQMLTIHCQGGQRMAEAAMLAVAGLAQPPLIMGVTALTSFGPGEMPGIAGNPSQYALHLAGLAKTWGLNGVICSGFEAADIGASFPGLLRVCPGIRPAGADLGDQRRVMTPGLAVAAGADFLVVGRPITASKNPLAAAENILSQMRDSSR